MFVVEDEKKIRDETDECCKGSSVFFFHLNIKTSTTPVLLWIGLKG